MFVGLPLCLRACANNGSLSSWLAQLQTKVHSKPLLASQRPDRRVIQIQQGCPVLLREQGQNPTNDNSAVLATFQVPCPLVILMQLEVSVAGIRDSLSRSGVMVDAEAPMSLSLDSLCSSSAPTTHLAHGLEAA